MLEESTEALSADDRELVESVRQHGFHWFSVGQAEEDLLEFPDWSDVPNWSYTVGLYALYGHPEIVVFELESDIVGALFWDLLELIQTGQSFEPGQLYDDVLPSFEGQRFMFEPVSPGWISALFGTASWFYKHENFPVMQYLWPDNTNLFVGEPGAAERLRDAQPVLTEPPDADRSPPPRRT